MTNYPPPDQRSPYADNGGRPRSYDVQPWRKWTYYTGGVLVGIGLLLFFSVFIAAIAGFAGIGASSGSPLAMGDSIGRAFRFFPLSFVGFFLIGIGQWIRGVGKKGLAGSGVVLSPQGEARDAEPWRRSEGAQDQMRLEEIPTLRTAMEGAPKPADSPAEVVKLRCRSCGYLETEDAAFCSHCGQRI
ncbi:zinc ribbon domain-containing protein [Actinomyces sp. MRS3W]|uniref:zinc ribbon domain-containing protein n=1 Tax=Actinomyces sp. MRS3W TaxID=2800796 RepID=UPI0028FDC000|nr:zinc ribbon domain-containing protein [Actinomyces sp. MRS3W]MDU0348140.1 zinc ribbon domain-containing protein [Actinomyces sp. MRS3W]